MRIIIHDHCLSARLGVLPARPAQGSLLISGKMVGVVRQMAEYSEVLGNPARKCRATSTLGSCARRATVTLLALKVCTVLYALYHRRHDAVGSFVMRRLITLMTLCALH